MATFSKESWKDVPEYMGVGEHKVKIVSATDCVSQNGKDQVKIVFKNEKGETHGQFYPTSDKGLVFLFKVFSACQFKKENATDTNLLRGCRLIVHLAIESKKVETFDNETGEKTIETVAGYPKIIRYEQDSSFDRDKQAEQDLDRMEYDAPDPF